MLPETLHPKLLRQLELLKLRARRRFLGTKQGGHLSLRRGHGIEFSDYRQYQAGDNPRNIDWGIYARSDRLFIKRYQEEQDLTVLIVVDSSASMAAPLTESKWQYARDIALAAVYIALMQQDSVVLAAPEQLQTAKVSGAKAIHNLAAQLLQVQAGGQPDLARAVQLAAAQVRFPGVAIVISDFLLPLPQIFATFNALRARNLDITAIQVLSQQDFKPWASQLATTCVDSETAEELNIDLGLEGQQRYSLLLAKHNQNLLNYFAETQVSFSQITTEEDFDFAIIECLLESGLFR